MNAQPLAVQTFGLRALSNVFMTFAWYGHLNDLTARPGWITALVNWGIALFGRPLQVPTDRFGDAGG